MVHQMGLYGEYFPSIREGKKIVEVRLNEDIPLRDFDCEGWSIQEMVDGTYEIYTPEQEKRWGTLAITIRRCDDAIYHSPARHHKNTG